MEKLLAIPEACDRLGVSRQMLWRLVRSGRLPCVRLGRRTLFRVPDLERLVERSMRGGSGPS